MTVYQLIQKAQLALIVLLFATNCFAAELAGVTLPDSIEVGGKKLHLNGLGLREATVFSVDVYVAGLYLEKKTNNVVTILGDKGNKRLVLQFVRDVGVDKIRNGWTDGFGKNVIEIEKIQDRIQVFNNMMSDISEGQNIVLTFVGSDVEVEFAGKSKGKISGVDFQQGLLSIWLGSSPPNPELRQGLLGN